MAIQSFGDKGTRLFFISGKIKKEQGWSSVSQIVMRKLDMLHYAAKLEDLTAPPGNRLKLLKGRLKNYYSVRINSQWRLIFRWSDSGPEDVQITDYH